MFRNYGNLDVHHQETAFIADYGRAAFENYLNHGTIPTQPGYFRTSTYLNSTAFQTIDVRSPPNSNSALLGDRRDREAYWAAQLRFNMENWRRGHLGVIQIDRDALPVGDVLRPQAPLLGVKEDGDAAHRHGVHLR